MNGAIMYIALWLLTVVGSLLQAAIPAVLFLVLIHIVPNRTPQWRQVLITIALALGCSLLTVPVLTPFFAHAQVPFVINGLFQWLANLAAMTVNIALFYLVKGCIRIVMQIMAAMH